MQKNEKITKKRLVYKMFTFGKEVKNALFLMIFL